MKSHRHKITGLIDTKHLRSQVVTPGPRQLFRKKVPPQIGQVVLDLCDEIDKLAMEALHLERQHLAEVTKHKETFDKMVKYGQELELTMGVLKKPSGEGTQGTHLADGSFDHECS